MGTVADNLSAVRERMAKAAARVARDPEAVTLVAVTKTMPAERIRQAIDAGHRIFGENRVQEAQAKIEVLGHDVRWHLIGHLQRNKVKLVCDLFDLIESVDSLPLAQDLNTRAGRHGVVMPILIQVNIGDETTKSGVDESEALALVRHLAALPHLAIKGLMCVPPAVDVAEHARPYFVQLRALAERIDGERIPNVSMTELSMGMSHDFEVAIEEGATMVRVGSAIFGDAASVRMLTMLNEKELTLIGGGNMGEAILKGLITAQLVAPQRITVTDVIEARVAYLRDAYGVRALTDNAKAVSQADLIVLAVKPQDIVQTIQGIAPVLHDQQMVISIAAGVPTAKIETAFAKPVRVVRVMPNTPALVLAGAAGLCAGSRARKKTWKSHASCSMPWEKRCWCPSI